MRKEGKIRFACCRGVDAKPSTIFSPLFAAVKLTPGTVISRNEIVRDTASCHPMISRPDTPRRSLSLIRAPRFLLAFSAPPFSANAASEPNYVPIQSLYPSSCG